MNTISKDSVSYLEVGEEDAGQRLDNYLLRHLKGVPKSHVYRIIRSGEVRVNKGRTDAMYRVNTGDLVRLPPIRIAESAPTEKPVPTNELPIVYEDEALLVINKPAGIAVHGGSGVSFGVIEQMRAARPQAKFLELVHRLDRETSGLLLIAKKRSALVAMHDAMRGTGIDKRYLAMVPGAFPEKTQHLKFKLFKYNTEDGERRVRVSADGQEAHTIVRRQQCWSSSSLVEAELKTGRTHQIRVHLAHCGFPIMGDEKYGDFGLNRQLARQGLKRMFLHAWRLRFKHPLSDQPLVLEAPLPPELQRYLERLTKEDAQ
ncbi:RluA family pseudouridine synthase [Parachitinimonas caeni]|uniref:Pseudouridine synthase n=1 Tax=Parachitinimonas caeni TaxID=3031301 RepID=A0ABT7DZM1_9NEIS|nr:RluA family pseudouridine synthase [Parachitinimonas caeni]MDK2125508.1 RluA family pseudouridine synthase [Parachitinimonas caeni]